MKNKKNAFEKLFILCLYFFIFLYFKPDIIRYNETLNNIINGITIASSVVVLPAYFVTKNKSKSSVLLLILFSFLALTTALNGEDLLYFLKNYSPVVLLVLYLESSSKIDKRKTFNALTNVLLLLNAANFISLLAMPKMTYQAESRYMLLGYDNAVYPILILGTCIALSVSHYFKQKTDLRAIVMLTLTVITCFMIYSSTAKIGAILLLCLAILIHFNPKLMSKILNYRLIVFIGVMLSVAVVFFQAQNLFQGFIEDSLQRNVTLTGRTAIWKKSISQIEEHPILGVGAVEPELSLTKYGVFHSHNTYLQFAFMGGIVALVLYLVLLFQQGDIVEKHRNEKAMLLLVLGVALYLLFSIDEYFLRNQIFFSLLIMMQNIYGRDDNAEQGGKSL